MGGGVIGQRLFPDTLDVQLRGSRDCKSRTFSGGPRSSYHVQVRTVRSCRSPHDRCHLCVKTARLRGESLVLKDASAKQHEKRNICSMEGGERVHQL